MIEGFRTTHHNLLKLFQFAFVAQATYTFCYDWSILLFLYHVMIAALIGRGLSDPRRWGPSSSHFQNLNHNQTNSAHRRNNENRPSSSSSSSSLPSTQPCAVPPSGATHKGFAIDENHPYQKHLRLRHQEGLHYNVRMRVAKATLCILLPLCAHLYLFDALKIGSLATTATTTVMPWWPASSLAASPSSSSSLTAGWFSPSFLVKVSRSGVGTYLIKLGILSERSMFVDSENSTLLQSSSSLLARENMLLQARIMSSSVLPMTFAIDRCGLLWMLWLDFVRCVLAFAMLSVDCHDSAFCLDLSR